MEKLTKDGFRKSVFNYEAGIKWEYQGDTPCLIEFHDDSCPPCQALAPVIQELSEEYKHRILLYRVDVTEGSVLAEELGVKNMPTLVLCPLNDKPIVYQGATSKVDPDGMLSLPARPYDTPKHGSLLIQQSYLI